MSEEVLKSRSDEFLSKNKEAIVKLFSEENKGKLWDITIPEFSFVGNNEKDGPKSVIKEEKTSFPQPSDCCKSITVAGEERHCKFSLAGCNNPTNGDLYFGFYVISNLDGRKDLCAGSYGQDGEIIILPIMDNYRSTISVRPAIKLTDEAMKMLNLNNENINSIQLGSYPQKEEFYTISSSYDDPHKQDNYYNGNSDEERAPVEWHIDYEHKELVADRGLAACDAKCFDSDDYEGSDLKKFVDNMSCQMFKNLEKEIPDNYSIKKEEPAPTKEKALQDLSAALNQLQKDTMTDYGDADMDISKLLKNNEESENQSISVKR